MFFFLSENPQKAILNIRIENTLQIGSLSYLISSIETNYIRLLTTGMIIKEINNGASDGQFLIARNSSEIFTTEERRRGYYENISSDDSIFQTNQYNILGRKDGNPKEFWRLLGALRRPVVLFKDRNGIRPLYSFDGDESLKLLGARLASPAEAGFEGLLGPLIDLVQLPGKMRREEEKHQQESQIRQSVNIQEQIRAVGEFARVSRTLEEAPRDSGYYIYAKQMLDQIGKHMERTIKNSDASFNLIPPRTRV